MIEGEKNWCLQVIYMMPVYHPGASSSPNKHHTHLNSLNKIKELFLLKLQFLTLNHYIDYKTKFKSIPTFFPCNLEYF